MNFDRDYKSWLPTNERPELDPILGDWTAYGTPTISQDNEIVFDGNSYLKSPALKLFGKPFTIGCYVEIDEFTAEATVFTVNRADTNEQVLNVRVGSNNTAALRAWACNYGDASQDYGHLAETSTLNGKVRINLDYDYKNNNISIYVYSNKTTVYTSCPLYERVDYNIYVGANSYKTNAINRYFKGKISNFYIVENQYLSVSGPGFGDELTFFFGVDRKVLNATNQNVWKYKNAGYFNNEYITTSTGGQVDFALSNTTKSKTGVAFYQTTRGKCFDIPETKDVWIKFDVYFDGTNRWRCYDAGSGSNGITGITSQTTGDISFFNANTNVTQLTKVAKKNQLQTVLFHMSVAESRSSFQYTLMELWVDGEFVECYKDTINQNYPFKNIYLQSDGAGTLFSNVIISNAEIGLDEDVSLVPDSFDIQRKITNNVSVDFDVEREVHRIWKYKNYGTASLLSVAGNTVNNLPENKSITGSAFWQSGRVGCFDIPATKELWVKFDLYYGGSAKWRAYDRKDGKDTGIARMNDATSIVSYINGPLLVEIYPTGFLTANTRKTYLLHMVSDATNGYIELWVDGRKFWADSDAGVNRGRIYEGNVNDGDDFANFYLQSDNATNLFSNVIISNAAIGLDENTYERFDVDISADIYRSVNLDFDVVRQIISQEIDEEFEVDTERKILISYTNTYDIDRILERTETVDNDAERKLENNIDDVIFDAERKILITQILDIDTERILLLTVNIDNDIERIIERTEQFDVDIWRKIPWKITVIEQNTFTPSAGQNHEAVEDDSFLQSININLSEQQLTDNISFVIADDLNIMDGVRFQYLDYIINGRVEETIKKGVLQTCKCTCDIDEILYKQLAYEIPETEYSWSGQYLNELERMRRKYPEKNIQAVASASASTHFRNIASKLGKNVSIQFDDWISTMSTKSQSGTNYSSLIQELFGWTSRIPTLLINCYMRNNTIYAVQRGHENNVVNLDNLELTLHTTRRKLIRMTWGSDPWSKSEVKTFNGTKNWDELMDKTPINLDEGGGAEYNDEGLVESTTVTHGNETVITNYTYTELANGKKFLSTEESITLVNGQEVDRITTVHDPVRNTQSHVYSVDDSGVLGSVLTSSINDDRITPYAAALGGGYKPASYTGHSDGTVYSDGKGNYYWVSGVGHFSETYEQGQLTTTIHGVSLIDTSFPVEGQQALEFLTNAIKNLDRKTEESISVDLYNYHHIIDFNDRIIFNNNVYFLRSNNVVKNERIVNKQSLEFVRWF